MKKKPRIAIDALGIDIEGGARTSILNLIINIVNNTTEFDYVIYLSKKEPELNSPQIKQVILPFRKGIIARLFMQLFLPFDVLLRRIDLIHFTKSQSSIVFFTKSIFTIHDLTIIQHPELHSNIDSWYWKNIQPAMAKAADAIVTVSKNAAEDLHNIYNIPLNKITVVYNTSQFSDVDEDWTKDTDTENTVLKKYSLTEKYLLYVGIIALKKNLKTIIKAYDQMKGKEYNPPQLILIGPKYPESDGSSVFSIIKELGLDNEIRYLGRVPKQELYYVFKNATIFLFPSIHEGFGIPCLEAMELGVPLIASNVSAIPEVVGDAGILLNDYMSPEVWANNIIDLLENNEKRTLQIEKGEERVGQIQKDLSYKRIIQLYKDLLKKKISPQNFKMV